MKRIQSLQAIRLTKYVLSLMIMVVLLQACGNVPLTGRRQLQLVSDQEVLTMSLQQYNEFITTAPLERNTANAQLITKVGSRIANAVETFLKSNGYESELQKYAWSFDAVKSNEVNAFAMPGGKVVVYTGLLPVTQDENGLAVVLGHEIAHVVAKHANERMSQQLAAQYGGAIVGGLLGGSSQATKQIAGAALGLGAQYGMMLPYSRAHEYEADKMGIIFMALAGYDPRTAITFWQRMSSGTSGSKTPEYMSTHPSDQNRIAKLQAEMNTALQYYKGTGVTNTSTSQPIKVKTAIPYSKKTNTQTAKTSDKWKF